MSLWQTIRHKAAAIGETLKFDNRWQLLLEEVSSGRSLRIYRLGTIEAVADHAMGDHLGGIRGVLASDEYRGLLRGIDLSSVRYVLDLGAHIGGFPLLLKQLGTPLEQVVCVEPNPASLRKLKFNLEHNGIPAKIVNAAVADKVGMATLHAGTTSTGFSLLADHPNRLSSSFEVTTTTLPSLIEDFFPNTSVDLCKMDIEGAEFDVLQSAHPESLRRCRRLICEVHSTPQRDMQTFERLMGELGFSRAPAYGPSHTALFINQSADNSEAMRDCRPSTRTS